MWPRMLKLSMYTSYGKRKKANYFQGQRSNFKVTGPLLKFWYFDMEVEAANLISRSKTLGLIYKDFWHSCPCLFNIKH